MENINEILRSKEEKRTNFIEDFGCCKYEQKKIDFYVNF